MRHSKNTLARKNGAVKVAAIALEQLLVGAAELQRSPSGFDRRRENFFQPCHHLVADLGYEPAHLGHWELLEQHLAGQEHVLRQLVGLFLHGQELACSVVASAVDVRDDEDGLGSVKTHREREVVEDPLALVLPFVDQRVAAAGGCEKVVRRVLSEALRQVVRQVRRPVEAKIHAREHRELAALDDSILHIHLSHGFFSVVVGSKKKKVRRVKR